MFFKHVSIVSSVKMSIPLLCSILFFPCFAGPAQIFTLAGFHVDMSKSDMQTRGDKLVSDGYRVLALSIAADQYQYYLNGIPPISRLTKGEVITGHPGVIGEWLDKDSISYGRFAESGPWIIIRNEGWDYGKGPEVSVFGDQVTKQFGARKGWILGTTLSTVPTSVFLTRDGKLHPSDYPPPECYNGYRGYTSNTLGLQPAAGYGSAIRFVDPTTLATSPQDGKPICRAIFDIMAARAHDGRVASYKAVVIDLWAVHALYAQAQRKFQDKQREQVRSSPAPKF